MKNKLNKQWLNTTATTFMYFRFLIKREELLISEPHRADFTILLSFFKQLKTKWNNDNNSVFVISYSLDFKQNGCITELCTRVN